MINAKIYLKRSSIIAFEVKFIEELIKLLEFDVAVKDY